MCFPPLFAITKHEQVVLSGTTPCMSMPQQPEESQQPGHGCQTSHACELPWQLSRQASDRHVRVAGSHLHVGPPRRLHFLLRLHGWPPHAAGRDAAVDVSTGAA
jgi:hypothetical protein